MFLHAGVSFGKLDQEIHSSGVWLSREDVWIGQGKEDVEGENVKYTEDKFYEPPLRNILVRKTVVQVSVALPPGISPLPGDASTLILLLPLSVKESH